MTNTESRSVTTVDEFKDIIASAREETLDRERARAEAPPETVPVSRQRASLAGLVISAPIFAILLAVNVWDVSLTEMFTPTPSPAIALQHAQTTLDRVVSGIEGYYKDYRTLPNELVQVGVPSKGTWTYTKLPGGLYEVVGKVDGQVVTFRSTGRKRVDEPQS